MEVQRLRVRLLFLTRRSRNKASLRGDVGVLQCSFETSPKKYDFLSRVSSGSRSAERRCHAASLASSHTTASRFLVLTVYTLPLAASIFLLMKLRHSPRYFYIVLLILSLSLSSVRTQLPCSTPFSPLSASAHNLRLSYDRSRHQLSQTESKTGLCGRIISQLLHEQPLMSKETM